MSGSLRGLTAHDRHLLQASVYDPGAVRAREQEARRLALAKTDFDLLKEAHRFIRDDDDDDERGQPGPSSEAGPSSAVVARGKDRAYADAIARRYEAGLFKEFALVDLKRYKSGRIALRWRTPDEVVDAVGEETCGSLRCAYHAPDPAHPPPALSTFELPFAYVEDGTAKQAMVKVVVCARCAKKLRYKPDADASGGGGGGGASSSSASRWRGRSASASPARREEDGRRERGGRSERVPRRAGEREGSRRERASTSPGRRRRTSGREWEDDADADGGGTGRGTRRPTERG